MALMALCFTFVGGIAAALLAPWSASVIGSVAALIGAGAAVLALGLSILALHHRRKQAMFHGHPSVGTPQHVTASLALIGWMIVAACIGAWRYAQNLPTASPHNLLSVIAATRGSSLTLQGTIATDPIVKDTSTVLQVSADSWVNPHTQQSQLVTGMIEITLRNSSLVYAYADQVTLTGKLMAVSTITDTGYQTYLRSQGVSAVMIWPKVQQTGNTSDPGLEGLLLELRHRVATILSQALPQPAASLVLAILLGGHASSLPKWLVTALVATGLIHIIAVSGLKIALLAGGVYRAAIRLIGRRDALYPALAVTWMYVAVTGASPAALRSGIMWSLSLLAPRLGRQSDMMTGLALAATVILAIHPALLMDTGFQMSFLGVAGISIGADWIAERLTMLPLILRESLALTLSAQIATLPIVVNAFGTTIALVSPLANTLVLPLLAPIMVLSGIVVVAGLLSTAIASTLGLLLIPPTEIVIAIATLCSRIPLADWIVPAFSSNASAGYYGILGGIVVGLKKHRQPGRSLDTVRRHSPLATGLGIGVVSVIVGSLALGGIEAPDQTYHITFLNVGHGQSIVLQTPRGNNILINGGDQPSKLQAALDQTLPYWRRSLSLVLATTLDNQHVGGLLSLPATHQVTLAADSGSIFPSVAYASWRAALRDAHVPYRQIAAGTRWVLGLNATLDVLAPDPLLLQRSGPLKARTNLPVALRLRVGRFSMLILNSYALSDEKPQFWNTIGAPPTTGDSVIVLPDFPQTNNAAGALLLVHPSQIAILPSQNDSVAMKKQTGSLFIPPGIRAWTAGLDSRFAIATNGVSYQVTAMP